jgi:hypothetical protein
MQKLNLPKSIRKYVRLEKAKIRRSAADLAEQKKLVNELYERVLKREGDPTSTAKTAEAKGKPKKDKASKKAGAKTAKTKAKAKAK